MPLGAKSMDQAGSVRRKFWEREGPAVGEWIWWRRSSVMGKPWRAREMEGWRMVDQGRVP